MMVQMSFSDVVTDLKMYEGHALCASCGKEVGPITLDELRAMMSGRYGDVLCFDCEELPPKKMTNFDFNSRMVLNRLYPGLEDKDFPLNAWYYWASKQRDAAMQLHPKLGWCFWIVTPDWERWTLKRVHMSNTLANIHKATFEMLPVSAK